MKSPDSLYRIPAFMYQMVGVGLLVSLIAFIERQPGSHLTRSSAVGAQSNVYQDLGQLRFDSKSAALTPDTEACLRRAASLMHNDASLDLRLEGYTPAKSMDPGHANIAQQRSVALQHYLADLGVDSSHVTGSGFVYEKPSAARADKRKRLDLTSVVAMRENNRRIQLFVR